MKMQAGKHRIGCSFGVGGQVFLKLQPCIQASIAPRDNHNLAYKFFGPYTILERVSEVAYHFDLPATSKVHPIFHVSLLCKMVPPDRQVLPLFPPPDAHLQVSVVLFVEATKKFSKLSSDGLTTLMILQPLKTTKQSSNSSRE